MPILRHYLQIPLLAPVCMQLNDAIAQGKVGRFEALELLGCDPYVGAGLSVAQPAGLIDGGDSWYDPIRLIYCSGVYLAPNFDNLPKGKVHVLLSPDALCDSKFGPGYTSAESHVCIPTERFVKTGLTIPLSRTKQRTRPSIRERVLSEHLSLAQIEQREMNGYLTQMLRVMGHVCNFDTVTITLQHKKNWDVLFSGKVEDWLEYYTGMYSTMENIMCGNVRYSPGVVGLPKPIVSDGRAPDDFYTHLLCTNNVDFDCTKKPDLTEHM